jgi:hypothetical protein
MLSAQRATAQVLQPDTQRGPPSAAAAPQTPLNCTKCPMPRSSSHHTLAPGCGEIKAAHPMTPVKTPQAYALSPPEHTHQHTHSTPLHGSPNAGMGLQRCHASLHLQPKPGQRKRPEPYQQTCLLPAAPQPASMSTKAAPVPPQSVALVPCAGQPDR